MSPKLHSLVHLPQVSSVRPDEHSSDQTIDSAAIHGRHTLMTWSSDAVVHSAGTQSISGVDDCQEWSKVGSRVGEFLSEFTYFVKCCSLID